MVMVVGVDGGWWFYWVVLVCGAGGAGWAPGEWVVRVGDASGRRASGLCGRSGCAPGGRCYAWMGRREVSVTTNTGCLATTR